MQQDASAADTTPPEPFSLLSPADGAVLGISQPLLSWQPAADIESGIDRYDLSVVGQYGAPHGRVCPMEICSLMFGPLPNGTFTWQVKALDKAGNSRMSLSRTFTIAVPPLAATVSFPNGRIFDSPTPELTWSRPYPSPDYELSFHFELLIDGSRIGPDLTPNHNSFSPPDDIDDGPHTFAVRVVDTAGYASTSETRSFMIDTVPPAEFDLVSPANGAQDQDPTPAFSWNKAIDATIDSGRYELWIDGQYNMSVPGSSCGPDNCSATPANPLPVGLHSWTVKAYDGAGNTRNTDSGSFEVAPDTVLVAGPSGRTVATSAQFSFSSPTSGATFECQLDGGTWVACASSHSVSSLSDGPHTFQVRGTAQGRTDQTPATRTWTVDTSSPPTAELSASQTLVETGQSVSFNAGSSFDHDDGTIVSYEWDPEGDGTFGPASGSTLLEHSYDNRGTYRATVKVTNNSGKTAVASQTIEVRLAAPDGTLGVTVNDAAQFTNDPNVSISAVWPSLATRLLVSNDGGFKSARNLEVNSEFSWTLDSSGAERLPKTVYVRYFGGSSGRETYQDDIILDETAPIIDSATISDPGANASIAFAAIASAGPTVRIRLKAFDKTSGIKYFQTAVKKSRPSASRRYRKSFFLRGTRPKFIRVRDRAGNFSKWKRLRLVR